ncbi:UbiA family prenyltransferase [Allohahella marinimesophila]|uniref:UbiA family prenyltransferase n=2 Tax=Allohahella marinimesophila TaxID=1054972 RepID=A0ABP7Q9W7_9GAMM
MDSEMNEQVTATDSKPGAAVEQGSLPPLCVDLDGTLIKSDLLIESFLRFVKLNPLHFFWVLVWLYRGKAHLKYKLAAQNWLSPELIPYNQEVVTYLRAQKKACPERAIILCTASNERLARQVAEYVGVFDEVIASNEHDNIMGSAKAKILTDRFGHGGFDYIGNDWNDWKVWSNARQVLVATQSDRFLRQTQQRFTIDRIFREQAPSPREYLKALRVHQWTKNALLFIPFLLEQRFDDVGGWITLFFCFISFSLLASATYIWNDLLDLDSDRVNIIKKKRAFASGRIPLLTGIKMMIGLVAISVLIFMFLPPAFAGVALLYTVITLAYSFKLKKVPILDVCLLASLYTLRIIAGMLAVSAAWSFWLLAFSMFFFLSLALAKRVSELKNLEKRELNQASGRGYVTSDLDLLQMLGVVSGFVSVLVVALYINSDKVASMYAVKEVLWLLCPVLLFWVGRIWMVTSRGKMHEDPIVFAIRDRVSLQTILICGVIVAAAMSANFL